MQSYQGRHTSVSVAATNRCNQAEQQQSSVVTERSDTRRSQEMKAYFCGRSLMSRTASLMRQSSLPSMGGTDGVPPVAIKMYLDCTDHQ